ncbi:50S ribosomal protein L25/general stress protein Ctc [Endozoicomonas gorgoniicola]|uniref:Large ribosomal subunit protein bL25 n=1 Tax=Endozoicomonas gorgoniicola TaxID=1234144 RepID=A0ABT3MPX1_9GAMM|nr:50S ribosomal protein L25/general stress protein Ctc [Endozoicomonas gorgoniicola]MCW7551084.1 50S ribosomal protein L25/general stress protein Ctc [Endozoicomonas gorgoniicola]
MSEAITLNAIVRKDVGKGASRRLRHEDKVPAIIYGGEAEPVQVTLEGKAIRKALESESFYSQIVNLDIEGAAQQVILKDVQRHPAKEFAMHMDFLRVDATHAVTTHVPLHFINEDACVGVKAGGAITHARVEVEIKCLPADLPEFIEVNMADVELGGHVHLSDLALPEGVQLVAMLQAEGHDLDVASVQKTRGAAEEDEASEEAGEE